MYSVHKQNIHQGIPKLKKKNQFFSSKSSEKKTIMTETCNKNQVPVI